MRGKWVQKQSSIITVGSRLTNKVIVDTNAYFNAEV